MNLSGNRTRRMVTYVLFIILNFIITSRSENITETEMFSLAITPKMFNWTSEHIEKQYSFHASLLNKPDLPLWLHYVYSMRHDSGFIYGTPPLNQEDITLQIVGLNRDNYETKILTIPLHITKKHKFAKYQVQLKIDNLNVEDLLDEYRMEQLKDIFRKKLWKDSMSDLYATFMVSAIELGARLPLKPNEGEGVVLKLGSIKPHSTELLQLQEEVRPLFKKSSCPRDFKRTTVERLFRDVGFNLDWCTFRLVETNTPVPTTPERKNNFNDIKARKKNLHLELDDSVFLAEQNRWLPPAKHEIPQRSYVGEFTFTIMVPMLVMIFLVSLLSMILCFHHEGITARNQVSDGKIDVSQNNNVVSDLINGNSSSVPNIQNGFPDSCNKKNTLGTSPNNSISKHHSPRTNANIVVDYNRPQPPPYLGSHTNTLVLQQGQILENELIHKRNQARALEESLQMLNEANIINPSYCIDETEYSEQIPIADNLFFDGNIDERSADDDYIAMKADSGLSLRRHIGIINGTLTNGDIMNNNEDF